MRYRRKNFLEPLPPGTVLVARPSRWGNPFSLSRYDRETALRKYEQWLHERLESDPDFLEPLRGKMLACYCPLDQPCHADILWQALQATQKGGMKHGT